MHDSSRKRLERANVRVVEAEDRLDAQRAYLARIEAGGGDTAQARRLLEALLDAVEVAKAMRRQVLSDIAGYGKP